MKKVTLFVAMLFLLGVSGLQAQEQKETATIEWTDINTALAQVGTTDKKILIDFYTDWCGWCKRMDRSTYADSSVIAYMNENYLAVKFNPEKADSVVYDGQAYSARQFAAAFSVRGYPATGFINEAAEAVTVIPGYQQPGAFLNLLRYIGDDHYVDLSFEEYMAGGTSESGSAE